MFILFQETRDQIIKNKLNIAIKELKSQGVNIVIGPIDNEDFDEVKKHNDLVFISPSNINPEFQDNIISIGISFDYSKRHGIR